MYLRLALTVVAAAVPFVDHATADVLSDHIRAGYPEYSEAKVNSAALAYLAYLAIVGALGSSRGCGRYGKRRRGPPPRRS
jgi:hypothetical protein